MRDAPAFRQLTQACLVFAEAFIGQMRLVARAAVESADIDPGQCSLSVDADLRIAHQMQRRPAAAQHRADRRHDVGASLKLDQTVVVGLRMVREHEVVARPVPTVASSGVAKQNMLDLALGEQIIKRHGQLPRQSNSGNSLRTAAAALRAASRTKARKSRWLSSPARSESARMTSQGRPKASATWATAPLSMSTATPPKLLNSRSRVSAQPR